MESIRKQRLIEFGASKFRTKLDYAGRTIWFGFLTCPECNRKRWVSDGQASRKKFSGICLSCTAKKNVKHANAPEAKRNWGVSSHLYRRGFTLNDSGYRMVSIPRQHPFRTMADRWGKIREHRLKMAEFLGRPLKRWEQVHHKNGDRQDNRIENLELLSMSQHGTITAMQARIKELENQICLYQSERKNQAATK